MMKKRIFLFPQERMFVSLNHWGSTFSDEHIDI